VEAALKALADDSRRTMLEALAEAPATVGELAALLPIARPGVSRHLRVLREAGLVDVRRVAQRRVYSLRPQPLTEINDWLSRYLALWDQRFDAMHIEMARGKRERRSTLRPPTRREAYAPWARCAPPTARASFVWRTASTPTSTTCGPL
jgi:DNA-binding transcriptional ArsR family regulator